MIGLGLIGLFAEEQGGVPTPPDVTYTVPARWRPRRAPWCQTPSAPDGGGPDRLLA